MQHITYSSKKWPAVILNTKTKQKSFLFCEICLD